MPVTLAVLVLSGLAVVCGKPGLAAPDRPRLVVLIVIDQFRYDYLARFDPHFGDGGFRRFAREGATFSRALYRHSTTDTCPGHAVIATGSYGDVNGIIANSWFDTARGRKVDCAQAGTADRALNLLRPTIGDVLKEADADSRVIVASGKRAAAVILGGQRADMVLFPDRSGRFQRLDTARASPAWLQAFNDEGEAESGVETSWTRVAPEQAYPGADDVAAEAPPDGMARVFPHSLTAGLVGLDQRVQEVLENTPFADETLIDIALSAFEEGRLGRDSSPDLLAISLSASDRVGHRFGPDSHEAMDTVIRLDGQLARLLDAIDRQVGLEHTLVVLTADHGGAPLPEVARREGRLDAGRVVESELAEAVARSLTNAYGVPLRGAWIAFHDFPNLFLDEDTLKAEGVPVEEAERIARDATFGFPGIRAAWTRTHLRELGGREGLPPATRMVLRSFRPDRSGHVVYQVLPYNVAAETGTNHGSHWEYDRHVPLLWLGAGAKAGSHARRVSPADIAPTIRAFLGFGPDPDAAGSVLDEVLPASGS